MTQTYNIDILGDVLLVLLEGDPSANDGSEFDFQDDDTLLDDAQSIDSYITERLVGLRILSPQPDNGERSSNPPICAPVRFRVSSDRLVSSSPVFKSILETQIGDPGAASESPNPIHIPIWNDNAMTMAIVLQVLHGYSPLSDDDHKHLKEIVPTAEKYLDQVDLPALAHIAVVVNKYNFHFTDAIERSLMCWIKNLWTHMEGESVADALSWVWITWVFNLPNYFDEATKYLATKITSSIEEGNHLAFSIPYEILHALNQQRLDALWDINALYVAQLSLHIDEATVSSHSTELESSDGDSSDEDDEHRQKMAHACNIGILIVEGKRLGLWPSPPEDFRGISFAGAAKKFKTSDYFNLSEDSSLIQPFTDLIKCLEERDWGLSIEFNRRESTQNWTY